ncbi:MAG: zinc ribbon domain-containing protein [Gemmataceae bacterium]|nr:zinc ribbon domain-containing protein [Gemmataceae bacterium]
MPTYDYRCTACGHTFDELQKFSDSPLTQCPACQKDTLERLFGGGGAIIFKGGGFYETDYRRAGEKKPDEGGKGETAASSPAKDTSAPAKTETKTDTKTDTGKGGGEAKSTG